MTMPDLDRTVHEPARLRILMLLAGVESADFTFLLSTLRLTRGNLSSHLDRLEKAGFIAVRKSFEGKMPNTDCALTKGGRLALAEYWRMIDDIRMLGRREKTSSRG